MTNIIKTLAILIFILQYFIGSAQLKSGNINLTTSLSLKENQYYIGGQTDIVTDKGVFYDNGGEAGNLRNDYAITTFHAKCNFLEIYFTDFNIPVGAQIRIYKGNTTNDELFGVFEYDEKPYNVIATDITIEYIPTESYNYPTSGWVGKIRTTTQQTTNVNKVTQPESDCIYAIPLCQNQTVIVSNSQYTDTGVENDDSGDCYSGTGSGGSVWFSFTPQATGPLDFSIAPSGSTDYDFVLWDITNGCASKTQILCNYEATHGTTGANSSGTGTSLGSSGGLWCSRPTVTVGHTYALCINFYAGSNDGYVLTFQNEASSVGITDYTIPAIENAFADVCSGASSFQIYFTEWVDCSTIQNSDFSLTGYTFTVTNTYCVNGRTDHIDISVSPSMPLGTYSVHVEDIFDMCGNEMNSNYNIVLNSVPTANAGTDKTTCKSPFFFSWIYSPSSQTLTASGGSSYLWSTGSTTSSASVSPTTTTTYTVTVANGACISTDQVTVYVENANVNAGSDQTVCASFPAVLNATTTTPGATFLWSNGPTTQNQTVTPAVTTTYWVTVTSPHGCTSRDNIVVNVGAGVFSITAPPFACQGTPITLSVPSSITAYTWNVGGAPIGTANMPLTVSPSVATTYSVNSTTVGCTGNSSVTVQVHPSPTVTVTANPGTSCVGVPVDLVSSLSASSNNVTEDFETANGFTLVNGSYNKWYWGTAAYSSGANGLYIGTTNANNNYVISGGFLGMVSYAATNHAYKDYTISSFCNADLSFKWRCMGVAGSAELTVWLVPTTFTPTQLVNITAGAGNILLGGPYSGQAAFQTVNIDLLPYAGQNVRIVFQWRNTGGLGAPAPVNTAAAIDDIVFSESTTYGYAWTSTPSGFNSTAQNPIVNPSVATTYDLVVTRCDGCLATGTVDVDACVPQPIELIDFSAKCDNGELFFTWSTASEQNNEYFTIEGSSNGEDFYKLNTIPGGGNSNSVKNYQAQIEGVTYKYYRLKQTDLDGKFTYSKIIGVNCFFEESLMENITIYPNPVVNIVTVDFNRVISTEFKAIILDMTGRTITEISHHMDETSIMNLNLDNLNQGIYYLQIVDLENNLSLPPKKFLKSK